MAEFILHLALPVLGIWLLVFAGLGVAIWAIVRRDMPSTPNFSLALLLMVTNAGGLSYSWVLSGYTLAAWIGGGEAWGLHMFAIPLGLLAAATQILMLTPLTLVSSWQNREWPSSVRRTVLGVMLFALCMYLGGVCYLLFGSYLQV